MPSYKLFLETKLHHNEIRRFSVEKHLTWDEFVSQLEKVLAAAFHPELRIQYVDSEGDRITVSSEAEWIEANRNLEGQIPLKFFITESLNPDAYFKDGPAPQPIGFYVNNNNNNNTTPSTPEELKPEPIEEQKFPEPEKVESLSTAVPRLLSNFFKGGRILPYNLPTWLKDSGAISLKPLPNNEVDLDIDINKLFAVLQKKAIHYLESKDFENARALLLDALALAPKDPVAYYNLSCTEALIGNIERALEYLESSIKYGYSNWQHMVRDEDLKLLWNNPVFLEMVRRLRGPSEEEEEEERTKKEEEERKRKEEEEQVARKKKEEEERLAAEQKKREEEEAEQRRKEQEEMERKEAERKAREEAERKEAERKEAERKEQERKEKEEAERKKKEQEKNKNEWPTPAQTKWAKQLTIIKDMGFSDEALIIDLLEGHKGDVVAVVQTLLN